MGAVLHALCYTVVVELEVLRPWSLGHHAGELIWHAEGCVDSVVGRQVGLAGWHEPVLVVLV